MHIVHRSLDVEKHTPGLFLVGMKLSKLVEQGKLLVDGGGHNKGYPPRLQHNFFYTDEEITEELVQALDKALDGGPALEKPLKFYGSGTSVCYHCNEPSHFETDGKSIKCTNPCIYPDGHPPFTIDLNVPSGVMIVGNDFRDIFPVLGNFDVNYLHGEIETTKQYEKVGLAHAFVGNTCPGVYQVGNSQKEFLIGCEGYDDEDNTIPIADNLKEVGGICTDLWWFSIADRDEYKKRGGKLSDDNIDKIKCIPGVYRFTHSYHLSNRECGKPSVFTKIEWLREPDPVVDTMSAYQNLDLTAGQVLLDMYDESETKNLSLDEIMLSAKHLMMRCSTRYLHANGWVGNSATLSQDLKDLEIPEFTKAGDWDLNEYSFLVNAAGQGKNLFDEHENIYLNESFTALAFNILNSIVKYGVQNGRENDKDTIKWAKIALKGLSKRYPDRIPDYCQETLKTALKNARIKEVTPARKIKKKGAK